MHRSVALHVGLLLTPVLGGCSRSVDDSTLASARIGRLGLMYGIYAGQHEGRPPASIEDLRRFGKTTINAKEMAALGVASADELFVSPRDGQPYKLIALTRLPPPVAGQPGQVVIYEQAGKDGKRLVAYLGGATEEVDEDKFRQLVPSAR